MIVYNLTVADLLAASNFYQQVFDCLLVLVTEDQIILDKHDLRLILTEALIGESMTTILINVDDIDYVTSKAIMAGSSKGKSSRNRTHNQRSSTIIDPFGISWELVMSVPRSPSHAEIRGADPKSCLRSNRQRLYQSLDG